MASKATQANAAIKHEPRAPKSRRIELEYKSYRLVAGDRNGIPVALAYAGTAVAMTTDGDTVDQALDGLKLLIDVSVAERLAARGEGPPTPDEYRSAIARVSRRISELSRNLLQIHHALPGHGITLAGLASVARCDLDNVIANYTRLGRQLAKAMHYTPELQNVPRSLAPLLTMATPFDPEKPEVSAWVLRPNLVEALAIMARGSKH